MTWPTDDQGQQEPPRPYQGSYPDSPFDHRNTPAPYTPAPPDRPTEYGGPTGYEAGYGAAPGYGPGYEQPLQYGVPTEYGRPTRTTGHGWTPPPGHGASGQWAPAPQPPTGRVGLFVGLAIVGLVLVIGAVAGILYVRGDGDQVADPGPTSSAPATTGARPTSPGPSSSSAPGRPDPTVAGWQVVVSGKRRLAYDVPPDWKILDEERIVGFSDAAGEPAVGMSGTSVYRDGYCAEAEASWRAAAGFSGYRDTDLALVATDAATKWSNYGYLGAGGEEPDVTVAAAAELTVNGITGAYTKAAIRVTAPSPCAPPTAVVHTFALPADQGSYVFVVVADQEVPDAFADDTIRRIIDTIRPMT